MARFRDAMLGPVADEAGDGHVDHELALLGEERSDEHLDGGEWEAEAGALQIVFTADDLRQGLLRGVPAHEIVAGAGKHWAVNSLLSDVGRSWVYSMPVREITAFVSHSWKASRILKWLALLMFFNGRSTAIASVMAALAAACLDCYHPIECLRASVALFGTTGNVTMVPFAAGTAVGAIAFFAGHHIRRIFEAAQLLTPRSAFLDKLVIHQDDPALLQRGIDLLGAFIRHSEVFLVLWSHEYLTRLWCSYELAVYVHLKDACDYPGRLCMWPLPLVQILWAKVMGSFFVGLCNWYLFVGFGPWGGYTGEGSGDIVAQVGTNILWAAATAVSTHGMISFAHAASMLEHQVREYDLRNVECFKQEDRENVEAAITAWFEPKSRDKAIERFNAFVREDLRALVGQSFSNKIPCSVALCGCLNFFFFDTLSIVNNGMCRVSDMVCQVTWGDLMADFPVQMLIVAWQFNAVRFIERCGEAEEGGPVSLEGARRRPFVLHFLVCAVIELGLEIVCYLVDGLPTPAFALVFVGVVLLALYTYR